MAAIYCADIYCDDCANDIKYGIAKELTRGDNQSGMGEFVDNPTVLGVPAVVDILNGVDEREYDSGEYPKNCSDDEESDSPQHCGNHDDCVNHGTLSDGFRYGYCFGNSLTTDGEEYVKEAVRNGEEGGVAREVWAVEYDYLDFELETDCDD